LIRLLRTLTGTLALALRVSAVVLMIIGFYLAVTQTAAPAATSDVAPLPTFGLSSEVRARIDVAAKSNIAAFICPERGAYTPIEMATCQDCLLYPIDKYHALPATYVPPLVTAELPGGGQLHPQAATAARGLFALAKARGHEPVLTSAYRSFTEQYDTFQTWVAIEKQRRQSEREAIARAGRYSARPGHSEHQLGTAVDINCIRCRPFDNKDQRNVGLWRFLEQNAHKYGFVISYPRDIEALTGYQYEPWHLRYIGVELATRMYDTGYLQGNGVCLTQFLSQADAPNEKTGG
jgi:zinc D-Ala-D-Ala carboxypeptidase